MNALSIFNLNRVCNVTTRPNLFRSNQQRTARRLPGRHHPGHSPYYQRNQAPHRHGRQIDRGRNCAHSKSAARWATSREPAVPRSHPPNCAATWAVRTPCTSTSPGCPLSKPPENSKPNPPNTSVRELRSLGITPRYGRRPLRSPL